MTFARAALALLAVGFATAVTAGCRTPTVGPRRAVSGSAHGGAFATGAVSRARPPRTFTIVFTTFIPSNYVLAPRIHPQSYRGLFPPKLLVFAGDDRGFDHDATCYRARQVVTVIPDQADDPTGLLVGSKQNLAGCSESFVASQALADGRIDDRDRVGALGEGGVEEAVCAADSGGMIIEDPVRVGPHTVSVRLRTARTGGPRNRLVFGSPSIDWWLDITIDTSGSEPTYQVAGTWDGYPAAELYINRQPVFQATPGLRPGSTGDLLKLLPGYGDVRFVARGTLKRSPTPSSVEPFGRRLPRRAL